MNKLKVGLISFAHGHANSYFESLRRMPEAEIIGIADEKHSRVEAVTERYGVPYFPDYRDLLATDADAVVICSENVHHARLTIEAARAKKHVLCEKPLGITAPEMEAMIAACRENGVQLMTAFPCRYLPAVADAKAAIDRGDIGEVVAIKGTNRGSNPGGWFTDRTLSGGGAVLDHTVHVMDLMNWMLGSAATEVYAYAGSRFGAGDIDDAGLVHVKFASGVFAVIDTSWSRPRAFPTWGDVTMEIVGTKGVITVDAFAQKNEAYSDVDGKASWSYWGDDMDELMIRDFVLALLSGRPVPVTGEDGLKSAAVALAAYESAKRGQPVSL
ncbi:Gfo/Idh/MocA family oxidoreductase [Paenibacillus sp. MWE-103]|uniref:Gfo/Idh/MocA family oxidoreductase n=1 Tax=Paenibacillus artemisiicola TaxID=1172618 RepID=A0ABS3W3W6_9BACL|nr:Gfo/Idh/MocA family oxidoreductase [Paenibacillus artemisiicola]MBO7742995.1 Gfo/Idh/MocA family oxidoreductase [Paenibacillus artemisiicola]